LGCACFYSIGNFFSNAGGCSCFPRLVNVVLFCTNWLSKCCDCAECGALCYKEWFGGCGFVCFRFGLVMCELFFVYKNLDFFCKIFLLFFLNLSIYIDILDLGVVCLGFLVLSLYFIF